MSNETDEIEAIFDQIRELSDELGLETRPYVDADVDEEVLGDIVGAPAARAGVRMRVVGGLAALAVAASVVTALTAGNGGSDRPNPDALSASLPAPSFGPEVTNESRLDAYSRESVTALKMTPQVPGDRLVGTLDELATVSEHIMLVEGNAVVRTIAGPDRTSRHVTLLGEPALELHPGLGYTGRLLYFAHDRPGDSYLPVVSPYAETSPGVFVATAPTGNQVRRFTTEQLDAAIKKR